MDARLNEPPKKVLRRSKIPPWVPDNKFGFTPGSTIYDPKRKIIRNPIVLRIRTRRSSIEKMFFMVVKKRFIYFTVVALPPTFSIAFVAVSEKACASTLTFDFNSPRPNIFTLSFLPTIPLSIINWTVSAEALVF